MSSSDSDIVDNPQPTTSRDLSFGSVFFYRSRQQRKTSRVVKQIDHDSELESDISIADDSDMDPDYALPPDIVEGPGNEAFNVSEVLIL